MRQSKEQRRQRRKTSSPLDKIFKYPVTCIKCSKGFLFATRNVDLSKARCPACGGRLRRRKENKKKEKVPVHPLLLHKMNKHKEANVKELLKQLAETKDSEEKRRLRRLLRRRGHHGGLRKKNL